MAGNSAVFEPADKAVIASVLYRPGRAPEQVPLDRIDASAASSGGLLWVGLKDPEPALLEQIGSRLGFSRKALEEIASPHRRPKVVEYEELTLIRSEEHTSELQSLMRISSAVFCLKTKLTK